MSAAMSSSMGRPAPSAPQRCSWRRVSEPPSPPCAAASTRWLVASLGADRVIDYTTEDFTAHAATYDVVFDAVGKTSFARCKPLLRPNGIFLATDFGPFPWNPLLAVTTRVVGTRRVLFPLPKDDQQIVRYLRERIQAGEFRPVIDRTYPLDDIAEAYRYVDTGQKVGNVVIMVA